MCDFPGYDPQVEGKGDAKYWDQPTEISFSNREGTKVTYAKETVVMKGGGRGFLPDTYNKAGRIIGIFSYVVFGVLFLGVVGMNVVPWVMRKVRERRERGIAL